MFVIDDTSIQHTYHPTDNVLPVRNTRTRNITYVRCPIENGVGTGKAYQSDIAVFCTQWNEQGVRTRFCVRE